MMFFHRSGREWKRTEGRGEMRECGVKRQTNVSCPQSLGYWEVFLESIYLHLDLASLVVIPEGLGFMLSQFGTP